MQVCNPLEICQAHKPASTKQFSALREIPSLTWLHTKIRNSGIENKTYQKREKQNKGFILFDLLFWEKITCAITLNYCTYTNHVGVSPRALYCVVDTSYGLGRSLGHCRPALPKGRKYQMVKTQTQSHVRRPVVWTNRWQIWVFFSFEFLRGTAGICHTSLWGFSEAL